VHKKISFETLTVEIQRFLSRIKEQFLLFFLQKIQLRFKELNTEAVKYGVIHLVSRDNNSALNIERKS